MFVDHKIDPLEMPIWKHRLLQIGENAAACFLIAVLVHSPVYYRLSDNVRSVASPEGIQVAARPQDLDKCEGIEPDRPVAEVEPTVQTHSTTKRGSAPNPIQSDNGRSSGHFATSDSSRQRDRTPTQGGDRRVTIPEHHDLNQPSTRAVRPVSYSQKPAASSPSYAAVRVFATGITNLSQTRFEEARESFQRAARISADFAEPVYGLAMLAFLEDDVSAAEQLLRMAIEIEHRTGTSNWGKRFTPIQGAHRCWVEDARVDAGLRG